MLMWIILSSAFIAVFLLVRALFSKKITASAMYALWILVAVRLLIPTYIPVEFNLFPAQNVPSITSQIEAVEDNISGYFAGADISTQDTANGTIPVTPVDTVVQDVTPNTGATAQDNNDNNLPNVATDTNPIITNITSHPFQFIWILGIFGFGCYFIINNIRFSLRLKRSRILLEGYECIIPVYLVKWLPAPCMTGLIHPAIYVNEQLYEVENPNYVIQHEYMHYCHKDMIWMLMQTILLCIHWFNPLVWIASYLFRKDCEYACDESVAKVLAAEERIAYGRTLLFFETTKRHQNSIFTTASSMSMDGKTMKKRVHAIVDNIPKRILSVVITCALIVILFAGSLIANTTNQTNSSDNTWNITYQIEDVANSYYHFFPDGTTELTQQLTYSFRENNDEHILDLYLEGEINSSLVVVKDDNNGIIQTIPEINYYMDETSQFYVPLKEVTNQYTFVSGVDGISLSEHFNGIYHSTEINSKTGVAGIQFYDDGTCKTFVRQNYQILNNHELKIGKYTYQYRSENDGDLLKLWMKDQEGTFNLISVGLAQSINVEVLEAGIFQDSAKCGIVTNTLDNGETVSYIPVSLYYSFWIENNSVNNLNDLEIKIVANEAFEKFLIEKNKVSSEDLNTIYSRYDSLLETLSASTHTIGSLQAQSRSIISYGYTLAKDFDILKGAAILKEEDDLSNTKDITDYVYDVTLIIYDDGKEIYRVDLSTLDENTTKAGVGQEPLESAVTYQLSLRTVGRNDDLITSSQITAVPGDLVLSLTEEVSEDVVNGDVEGDFLEGGIHNAILNIDYPFEKTGRDGTVITASEHIMKDVKSGDKITVTITKELQERLGLTDDQIVITCEGYDSKIIGSWERTSQSIAIGDVPAELAPSEGETVTIEATDTFVFREDKTGKWTTTYNEQHSSLDQLIDFTYELEGDQLTLKRLDQNIIGVFTVSFADEHLLLDGRNIVIDLNRIE